MKDDFFVFVCENASGRPDGQRAKKEAVPKHGLGLKLVRHITEKYGHLLQTTQREGFYRVQLAMQLNQSPR